MSELVLSRGMVAIVDDDLPARIANKKWSFMPNGYAVRCERRRTIYMHREIMNAPSGLQVDHINGNRLDNRRANLRLCSAKENARNVRPGVANTTGFKGVVWHKRARKFMAQIKADGERIYLGLFETAEDAARAYDAKAIELFGAFARPNTENI